METFPTRPSTREMLDLPNFAIRFLWDEQHARTSAMMKLQWCLGPEAAEYLKQHRISDPLLLIVVTNPNGRETREVVRLFDFQHLVEFYCAGRHEIHGRIFWEYESLKNAKKALLERSSNGRTYARSVEHLKAATQSMGNAEFSIEVPGEFFATLSRWEEWWVNFWYSTGCYDACQIRRRRMLAYTLQPLLVFIWMMMKTAWRVAVAFFFSVLIVDRNIQWSVILHPWVQGWKEIYDHESRMAFEREPGSFLLYKADGTERATGEALLVLFPLAHVVLFFTVLVVYLFATDKFIWWRAPIVYAIVLAAIAGVASAVYLGSLVFDDIASGFEKRYPTEWQKKGFYKRLRRWILVLVSMVILFAAWELSHLQVQHGSEIYGLSGLERFLLSTAAVLACVLLWRFIPTPKAVVIPVGAKAVKKDPSSLYRLGRSMFIGLGNFVIRMEERSRERERTRIERILTELSCDRVPSTQVRSIAAMPARVTQVPRLVFQNIKTKWCKPVARG